MDQVTIEKKTVEEAVEEALRILKVPRSDVEVMVEQESQKGFLGFGSKEARVTVTKKSAIHLHQPVTEKEEPKEKSLLDSIQEKASHVTDSMEEMGETVIEKTKEAAAAVSHEAKEIFHKAEDVVEEASENVQKAVKRYFREDEAFETEEDAIEGCRLYLETMMHKMGYEGEVKVLESEDEENVTLDIVPSDYKSNSRFIGKKGDTLASIGYLTSIYLSNRYMGDLRVEVDCGDYIYQKKEDIKSFARSAAQKAMKDGEFVLRPMTAYDRRIVHKTLNEIEGISTYSKGEEPRRRVVIVRDPQ